MGKVRLAARVPDDQYHGLMNISKRLLDAPHDVVLAVVKLDVAEIRTLIHSEGDEKHEGDEYIPVVKLLAIEPILHEPERARLATIYVDAYRARTGDGQTLDEVGGILQFPRSRDAQETGESDWPTPPEPSSEVANEEPADEATGQEGEEHAEAASSSGTPDDEGLSAPLTGDGTGESLPEISDATATFEGRSLRSVPLPAFEGGQ